MKFLRLDLEAYGLFTGRTLQLDGEGGGLHLVTGLNEAGKSTVLQAISDLLFGFGRSSSYAFLHDLPALTLSGLLVNRAGARLAIRRHKRNKHPLVDPEGRPLEEGVLLPFLGGVGPEIFAGLYGLSHERLRAGGAAILAGRGEVGSALFEAGSGVQDALRVLEDLESESNRRFVPRGRQRLLNTIRNEWQEARNRAQQAALSAEDWRERDERRRDSLARLTELRRELEARQVELSRLERLQLQKPLLARYRGTLRELEALRDLPEIGAGMPASRRKLHEELKRAKWEEGALLTDLAAVEAGLAGLPEEAGLLERGGVIEELQGLVGQFHKSRFDIPRRAVELKEVESGLARLLKEAGLAVDAPLPAAPVLARMGDLTRRHGELEIRRRQAGELLDEARGELERVQAELPGIPEVEDRGALAALLEEARLAGIGEARVNEAWADAARLEAEAGRALRELPLWSGDWEALQGARVPSPEQVAAQARTLLDGSRELEGAREHLEREMRRMAEEETRLSELRAEGAIPTPEAVSAARERRDLGWSLVRRIHVEGRGDLAEDVARFAGGMALTDAFARSMLEADAAADRLLAQAERTARYRGLLANLEGARARVVEAGAREREVVERLAGVREAWLRLWSGSGVTPTDPMGMRGWPESRRDALEKHAAWDAARRKAEGLTRELEAWRDRLQAALGDEAGEMGFSGWLRRAGEVVEGRREQTRRRAALLERLGEVRRKHDEAARRMERVEADVSAWRARWEGDVTALGWPPEVAPAEVDAAVRLLEEARRLMDRREELRRRIREMEADFAGYRARVAEVADGLGEVPGEDPIAWIGICHRRWLAAAETSRQRQRLAGEAAALRERIQAARGVLAVSGARLEELGAVYGVTEELAMEELEGRVARREEVRRELVRLERELRAVGGERELAELEREADGCDGDALPGLLAGAREEIRRLGGALAEDAARLGGAEADLARMAGGDDAAQALQEEESALVRLHREAECYVVTRLAGRLIGLAVARFRERNRDPVLARAGELFRRLTLESFAGLETDFTEQGGHLLLAVRPDGRRLAVEAMSDGTRDQLYLALHLAMLERRLETAEPLPLVLDDLLIHFDDRRAGEALRVLAEVGRKTQILFFTHHLHLVEVAQAVLGAGEFRLASL
ncbi:MAG: AAA family ATPase [Magnetococcales bacterium]|nr:AAA family ATPase [Magnetococcales bacterium]